MAGIGVGCPVVVAYTKLTRTLAGPTLMTVGPWKPISLQMYGNRIHNMDVRSQVSETLDVKLTAEFTCDEKIPGFLSFMLKAPDGSAVASTKKTLTDEGLCQVAFEWPPGALALWYPVGYGAQPLYTVEVELMDEVREAYCHLGLPDVLYALTERTNPGCEEPQGCFPPRAYSAG